MADIVLVTDGRRIEAHVAPASRAGDAIVRVAGRDLRVHLERLGPTTWRVTGEDGIARIARSAEHSGTRWLHLGGETLAFRIGDAAARRSAADRPEGLQAPMPGAVTQVVVREGEIVAAGQPIVIIEAMKMEHVIRAPHAGRVVALRVRQGDQVDAGAVVAELQAADAAAAGSAERNP
jgi:3-methylcrotonyl-CoA carboxylase alpha subunit